MKGMFINMLFTSIKTRLKKIHHLYKYVDNIIPCVLQHFTIKEGNWSVAKQLLTST